jgi:hypothetical protein
MHSISPASVCVALCLTIVAGALVVFQVAERAAPEDRPFFQVGAPGALPIEMLRLRPSQLP